ncbi:MAG: sigma-70 family RNA polymerase sigma factor [Candidatus Eisenbacteria bacterium]|uniref:Sigma-70 family RNA polymerase sigma factor n=1 Tax=Eiseniibacteriota bacterium TaxID=2212470 RepID=A0A538T9B5_UNCEI|nr:MAG: sigma-70 family RNA polymerase sigma factor [Candidatus Eisenbacteria bacterium]
MVEHEEDGLLDRCLAGDGGAYGQLIDRYQRALFNVSLRMVGNREDARDITQTVFLKAYENLGKFDRRHRFFSWVYRIMINESLNHLSRARRTEPLDETMASGQRGPDEDCARHRLHDSIQSALMDLSPDYRQVVVLRHFAQLSYHEMSSVLDVPEKTVKSRLHTARQLLGGILTRRGIVHS